MLNPKTNANLCPLPAWFPKTMMIRYDPLQTWKASQPPQAISLAVMNRIGFLVNSYSSQLVLKSTRSPFGQFVLIDLVNSYSFGQFVLTVWTIRTHLVNSSSFWSTRTHDFWSVRTHFRTSIWGRKQTEAK